jgi:CheY-like chemotaxis protein
LILRVDYPGRESARDFTEDLSAGGLFLRTDLPLKVGERLQLRLAFPPLLPTVPLEVEVVRLRPATATEPAGVGARIWGGDFEGRAMLSRLAGAATARTQVPVRVLIVEDNRLLAQMFSDTLKVSLGETSMVDVEIAEDGVLALERLRAAPSIHLVLTDLMMPRKGGFSLLSEMRRDPALRSIPAVVVTSDSALAAEELAIREGAALVLRKPLKMMDLVRTVRALVAFLTAIATER